MKNASTSRQPPNFIGIRHRKNNTKKRVFETDSWIQVSTAGLLRDRGGGCNSFRPWKSCWIMID
jgi:hypothetical protein